MIRLFMQANDSAFAVQKSLKSLAGCCYVLLLYMCGALALSPRLKDTVANPIFIALPAFLLEIAIVILCFLQIAKAVQYTVAAMRNEPPSAWEPERYNHVVCHFKLYMIPFFTVNCLIWLLLTIAAGPLALLVAPWGIFFTYMVLLASSSHAIAQLCVQYHKKQLPLWRFCVHVFLQLCFVADVLDYSLKKRKV